MKSRPIGSWSHTWKRTRAICGIWMLKTRVSSHIGLKPEWPFKGCCTNRKSWKITVCYEIMRAEVPLSSTTLVCCLEQSTFRPIISTSTKGSMICVKKKNSFSVIYSVRFLPQYYIISAESLPLLCPQTWSLWVWEAAVRWWSSTQAESSSVLVEDPPTWG